MLTEWVGTTEIVEQLCFWHTGQNKEKRVKEDTLISKEQARCVRSDIC